MERLSNIRLKVLARGMKADLGREGWSLNVLVIEFKSVIPGVMRSREPRLREITCPFLPLLFLHAYILQELRAFYIIRRVIFRQLRHPYAFVRVLLWTHSFTSRKQVV